MSLRQWSGPFVEIWIGDYFLAEGRLDSFAGGCTMYVWATTKTNETK
jgi:hypothetical protein